MLILRKIMTLAGLYGASLFLALSALFHIFLPNQATAVLADASNVRIVGGALCFVAVPILCSHRLWIRVIGLILIGSGLGRFLDPERMIMINAWTDKLTHGLLLGLGAVLLLGVAAAVRRQ